jgi:hypothetical protein
VRERKKERKEDGIKRRKKAKSTRESKQPEKHIHTQVTKNSRKKI